MAPIATRGNFQALASPTQVLLCNIKENNWRVFDIPQRIPKANNPAETNQETEESKPHVPTAPTDSSHVAQGTCVAVSQCCTLVAACTESKQLVVFSTSDLALVQRWEVPRKISTLKFTKDATKVVIADKAGDVYIYEISNPEPGRLILGHLSIVLDMELSEDEKYIITADRDEKIRVSRFPNAYNIHNFCLGHTEFVSSVSLLQSDPNIVISGSGDGSIKLWDYLSGKELHTESLSPVDEVEKVAVRKIAVSTAKDASESTAAIILNKSRSVLLYHITLNDNCPKLTSHTTDLKSQALDIAFAGNGELLVIQDDEHNPVVSVAFSSGSGWSVQSDTGLISRLGADENARVILNDIRESVTKDISPFFKRWFDNMQAYQVRKNERLTSQKKGKDTDPDCKKIKLDAE